jgi:DNA uptake protein ComE-like DNA-binding protein
MANNILNYRKNNGDFNNANQLIVNELVTNEEYEKIKSYISVE